MSFVPADVGQLKSLNQEDAQKIKGWTHVVYADASVAVFLTTLLTTCFLVAGAGVLRPQELAPNGADVAVTLSNIFSS